MHPLHEIRAYTFLKKGTDKLLTQVVRGDNRYGRFIPDRAGIKLGENRLSLKPFANLLEYLILGECADLYFVASVEMKFAVPISSASTAQTHPLMCEVKRQIPVELLPHVTAFELVNYGRSSWRSESNDYFVALLYGPHGSFLVDRQKKNRNRGARASGLIELATGHIISGPETLRSFGVEIFRSHEKIVLDLPCRCYGCELTPLAERQCAVSDDEVPEGLLVAEQFGLALRIPTSHGWRWSLRLKDPEDAASLANLGPLCLPRFVSAR